MAAGSWQKKHNQRRLKGRLFQYRLSTYHFNCLRYYNADGQYKEQHSENTNKDLFGDLVKQQFTNVNPW